MEQKPSSMLSEAPDMDHPLERLRLCLRDSDDPSDVWPRSSQGSKDVLHVRHSRSERLSKLDRDRLEERLRLVLMGHCFSRIEVHCRQDGWWRSLRQTLCGFTALRDCAVVCEEEDDRRQLRKKLRRWVETDYYLFPGIEALDPEGGPPDPKVFLVQELEGFQFREIFVSPEVNPASSSREQLIAVVNAARAGLHLVSELAQRPLPVLEERVRGCT